MKMHMVLAGAVFMATWAIPAWASSEAEKLLTSKGCLACHKVDAKLIGPAYKDVAAKFKNQKDAVSMLSEKIMKGSTGVWGNIPMPPNTSVKPDEAKILATYVMSLAK